MTPLVASRRIAVLAYTRRSREHARRALRAFGYAPLLFTHLDELVAMGDAAITLDMLILGDAPDTDSQGREVMQGLLAAIGPNVPVLHAPYQKRARARRGAVADPPIAAGVVAASPRFFSDLHGAIRSFLDTHGFARVPSKLSWGRYEFRPHDRIVAFCGLDVQLDQVSFDVALEFFFNAGIPLTTRWLKQMLPLEVAGALWHRIDNIACTIDDLRVALQSSEANGCVLEDLGGGGYLLRRVEPPAAAHEPQRRRRPAGGDAGAPTSRRVRGAPVVSVENE